LETYQTVEQIIMKKKLKLKNDRVADPYLDRRSGDDRREAYDSDYFKNGGVERRTGKGRKANVGMATSE
jgi:hypothetical protein